jgi:tetratricopeptide (TPR) repeat protein
VLNCIGVVHRNAGRPDQALEELRMALPMAESEGDPTMTATIHDNTALAYLEQGRLEDALDEESRACEIVESLGPRADAAVRARVQENLRVIRARLGQPA